MGEELGFEFGVVLSWWFMLKIALIIRNDQPLNTTVIVNALDAVLNFCHSIVSNN